MQKWNDLKIGIRLIIGFLLVAAMTAVVGVMGITGINTMGNSLDNSDTASSIIRDTLQTRQYEKDYVNTGSDEYVDLVKSNAASVSSEIKDMRETASDSDTIKLLDVMSGDVDSYLTAFNNYVSCVESNSEVLSEWTVIGNGFNALIAQIREQTTTGNNIYLQADTLETKFVLMRVNALYYVRTPNNANWANFQSSMSATEENARKLSTLTAGDAKLQSAANSISDYIEKYIAQANTYHQNEIEKEKQQNLMVAAGNSILGNSETGDEYYGGAALLGAMASDEAGNAKSTATTTAIAVMLGGVAVAIGLALFLQKSITGPINKVVRAAEVVSAGDLNNPDANLIITSKDEMGVMAESVKNIIGGLKELSAVFGKMADGDLNVTFNARSDKDIIGIAFNQMLTNLRNLVKSVKEKADNLNNSSQQLSDAAAQSGQAVQQVSSTSQQMATGAQEQASSLQQISAGMGGVAEVVNTVAKSSQEQTKMVEQASVVISRVSSGVEQVAGNSKSAADSAAATRPDHPPRRRYDPQDLRIHGRHQEFHLRPRQ